MLYTDAWVTVATAAVLMLLVLPLLDSYMRRNAKPLVV